MGWLRATSAVVALLLCVIARPAVAEFHVCNDTDMRAHAAVGFWDNTAYVTQGWYTVDPKSCIVVFEGPLQWQWYYVYAESDLDAEGYFTAWVGSTMLCVDPVPSNFQISGEADICSTAFHEINTKTSINWTHRLN